MDLETGKRSTKPSSLVRLKLHIDGIYPVGACPFCGCQRVPGQRVGDAAGDYSGISELVLKCDMEAASGFITFCTDAVPM
jgi:hypothetical protein